MSLSRGRIEGRRGCDVLRARWTVGAPASTGGGPARPVRIQLDITAAHGAIEWRCTVKHGGPYGLFLGNTDYSVIRT